jgi:hypothetical protein
VEVCERLSAGWRVVTANTRHFDRVPGPDVTVVETGWLTAQGSCQTRAPFTTFETQLPAGPHSILAASASTTNLYDLCGANLAMPTESPAKGGAYGRHPHDRHTAHLHRQEREATPRQDQDTGERDGRRTNRRNHSNDQGLMVQT